MKKTLGIYQFLRNGEKFDYPWRESILSAYPIANQLVKDPKKGFDKEVSFQSYYKDLGFPDPKMEEMKKQIGEEVDYVFLFENAIEKGQIRKFIGSHPKVMEERIKKFKDLGFEQFVSKMKDGLRILI
ncbi:MAG: hypothetical protein M0R03_03600 [Novosphingobium sp.]|nr:hypothetical protein [Novosphingobium sp.]